MFIVRVLTLNEVHDSEQSRTKFVIHAMTRKDLNRRVEHYFPHWVWQPDRSIFGGYWIDPKIGLTFPDREGETYSVDIASADEEKLIRTAHDWHDGAGSALYQFASTGCIFDEEHRSRLLDEIAVCQKSASKHNRNVLSTLAQYLHECVVLTTRPFPPVTYDGKVLVV